MNQITSTDSSVNNSIKNTTLEQPFQYFQISCLQCRKNHLKCDRLLPICSHCKHKNIECNYVPRKKREKLSQNTDEAPQEIESSAASTIERPLSEPKMKRKKLYNTIRTLPTSQSASTFEFLLPFQPFTKEFIPVDISSLKKDTLLHDSFLLDYDEILNLFYEDICFSLNVIPRNLAIEAIRSYRDSNSITTTNQELELEKKQNEAVVKSLLSISFLWLTDFTHAEDYFDGAIKIILDPQIFMQSFCNFKVASSITTLCFHLMAQSWTKEKYIALKHLMTNLHFCITTQKEQYEHTMSEEEKYHLRILDSSHTTLQLLCILMDKKQLQQTTSLQLCEFIEPLFQLIIEIDPIYGVPLQQFRCAVQLLQNWNNIDEISQALQHIEFICSEMRKRITDKPRIMLPWSVVLTGLQIKIISQWRQSCNREAKEETNFLFSTEWWKQHQLELATKTIQFVHVHAKYLFHSWCHVLGFLLLFFEMHVEAWNTIQQTTNCSEEIKEEFRNLFEMYQQLPRALPLEPIISISKQSSEILLQMQSIACEPSIAFKNEESTSELNEELLEFLLEGNEFL